MPLDNLARLAQERRDFVTAERLYREALRIDLRTRGKDHPQYIRHLHNLATAMHEQRRPRRRRAAVSRRPSTCCAARARRRSIRETIDATGNLGRLLMERGRFDEAQQTYETALAASRKAHPEPHVDVGYLLANLGRLALERQAIRRGGAALSRGARRSTKRRCRPVTVTRRQR